MTLTQTLVCFQHWRRFSLSVLLGTDHTLTLTLVPTQSSAFSLYSLSSLASKGPTYHSTFDYSLSLTGSTLDLTRNDPVFSLKFICSDITFISLFRHNNSFFISFCSSLNSEVEGTVGSWHSDRKSRCWAPLLLSQFYLSSELAQERQQPCKCWLRARYRAFSLSSHWPGGIALS